VSSSPATIDVRRGDGTRAGTVDLPAELFGIEPNVPVMHQVVVAQLAAARAGTHNTKTRSEVRGGGAKPWRQKGTGRARQGSTRAPNWSGGGAVFGPKPRSYEQRTPKKMKRLALVSALSDRAREGRVVVVELDLSEPSTRAARRALEGIGCTGRSLLVLTDDDSTTGLSFRNLVEVHVTVVGELSPYDILRHDWLLFTPASLAALQRLDEVSIDRSTAEEAAPEVEEEEKAAPRERRRAGRRRRRVLEEEAPEEVEDEAAAEDDELEDEELEDATEKAATGSAGYAEAIDERSDEIEEEVEDLETDGGDGKDGGDGGDGRGARRRRPNTNESDDEAPPSRAGPQSEQP